MMRSDSVPGKATTKFAVYQNPALSAALTANSVRPRKSTFLWLLGVSSASAYALLRFVSSENGIFEGLKLGVVSQDVAYLIVKIAQATVGLVFLGSVVALGKAVALRRKSVFKVGAKSPLKGSKDGASLTDHQLELLGLKQKEVQAVAEPVKRPPKSKPQFSSDLLVPIHHTGSGSTPSRSSRLALEKLDSSGGSRMRSYGTPSKSPGSSSPYLVNSIVSRSPVQAPALDQLVVSPWSHKRSAGKEIVTEEQLEEFLAEVDEKIHESAGKLATPPPTISSFAIASPGQITSSGNTSGATRSTPLRPVRTSPASKKFTTPPKKGEGELPSPMSMEESIEAFQRLGIYPQIEQWRDRLRQWFSSVLLNPLLKKIDTSHIQVMQSAAKLGISITINPVGIDQPTPELPQNLAPNDRTTEWQPTVNLNEDGLLHQLRATLVQAIDASTPKMPSVSPQQYTQQNPLTPLMQECVDAITEHQRLHALLKGEWVKGLLPLSSVREDYVVQRIRELAEGTCLKNYDYMGNVDAYDKVSKKWMVENPTDSHLLIYLFFAFLEHPKWMLHIDPTSYSGGQSSKHPLFLGVLPPKERFPEKYIGVLSSPPTTIHPGACVLVVGRQSPPIFALYWDKKLQFCLQVSHSFSYAEIVRNWIEANRKKFV
uniref:Transmembrane protein 209 n=1 Tax=Kalanchoe fedtschenkoi TaxID=63787 RepID=A0A7N0UTH4_KALFE